MKTKIDHELMAKALQVIQILTQEFPQCFKMGFDKKILKPGIHLEIYEHYKDDKRFTQEELDLALYLYTHSKQYLACLKEGIQRYDLHGKPFGFVTAKEAAYAKILLEGKFFPKIRFSIAYTIKQLLKKIIHPSG